MLTSAKERRSILTLHRYWLWADAMRLRFDGLLAEPGRHDLTSSPASEFNMYMSYWYAALYVVVEGWQSLGLVDKNIDHQLASPYLDLLKRYRNGVFHFQKKYWDDRFVAFLKEGAASASWVRTLHDAIGRQVLYYLSPEAAAKLK